MVLERRLDGRLAEHPGRQRPSLRRGAPAGCDQRAPPRRRAGRARVPRVPALPRVAPPRRPAVAPRDRRRPVRLHVGRHPEHPRSAGAHRRRAPLRPRPQQRARACSACAASARTSATLLADMARFAAAGHTIDIIVGNHDVELLAPEVVRRARSPHPRRGRQRRSPPARIRVVPWFVYVPGIAWIEHGHVYDEGCSFEFNLAPMRSEGRQAHLQRRLRRDPLPRDGASPRSIRTASRSGASGATCSTAGTSACARSCGCGLGYARFASLARSRARHAPLATSAATRAAASIASASRQVAEDGGIAARHRVARSIASRARR